MIKVETEEKPKEGLGFPLLMEGCGYLIVLFSNNSDGTVLQGNIAYGSGHLFVDWDKDNFKPFTGTITLSNGDNK